MTLLHPAAGTDIIQTEVEIPKHNEKTFLVQVLDNHPLSTMTSDSVPFIMRDMPAKAAIPALIIPFVEISSCSLMTFKYHWNFRHDEKVPRTAKMIEDCGQNSSIGDNCPEWSRSLLGVTESYAVIDSWRFFSI